MTALAQTTRQPLVALLAAVLPALMAHPATAQEQIPSAPAADLEASENPAVLYTPSGVAYWDVVEGKGDQPRLNTAVRLHFRAMSPDNTRVYSTTEQARPMTIVLDGAQAAWVEALATMKVGGKRRIQLPARLGPPLPDRVGVAPDSPLVFELDLIEVRGRALTGFQALALIVLAVLFVGSVAATAKGWIRRRAGIAWTLVWAAAAIAIVRPDFTAVIAKWLGIGRGADLVLYCAVVTMLVGFLMVYSRLSNLRREMTLLVRHFAIRDAHVNEGPGDTKPTRKSGGS